MNGDGSSSGSGSGDYDDRSNHSNCHSKNSSNSSISSSSGSNGSSCGSGVLSMLAFRSVGFLGSPEDIPSRRSNVLPMQKVMNYSSEGPQRVLGGSSEDLRGLPDISCFTTTCSFHHVTHNVWCVVWIDTKRLIISWRTPNYYMSCLVWYKPAYYVNHIKGVSSSGCWSSHRWRSPGWSRDLPLRNAELPSHTVTMLRWFACSKSTLKSEVRPSLSTSMAVPCSSTQSMRGQTLTRIIVIWIMVHKGYPHLCSIVHCSSHNGILPKETPPPSTGARDLQKLIDLLQRQDALQSLRAMMHIRVGGGYCWLRYRWRESLDRLFTV